MSIFQTSQQKLQVNLLILPESSMMTLASTLDTMRAANRISGQELFEWSICTIDGKPASLTCGLGVNADQEINDQMSGDILIVISGFNHHLYINRARLGLIKRLASRHQLIGGVEAGSWVLARADLLNARSATTHWEDLEEFERHFPKVKLLSDRFVIDKNVFTTGGASPTFDFMLHLIRVRYGYALSLEVSSAFIYDPVHSATDTQPLVSLGMLQHSEPRVAQAIQEMEKQLDETVSVKMIASSIGISVRMLENLFRQSLDMSPAAYYRRLRLQSARRMVIDTKLKIQEIAIRTGFNSLSAFSRIFKQVYQQSPGECRRQFKSVN